MRRLLLLFAAIGAAVVAAPAAAGTIDARVGSVATIVLSVGFGPTAYTNFDFDVYNCPAGEPITVNWLAEQDVTGASTVVEGSGTVSTGTQVQHLTVTTVGGFRPGYLWHGSGTVTCGVVVIPVSGSGQTLDGTGV